MTTGRVSTLAVCKRSHKPQTFLPLYRSTNTNLSSCRYDGVFVVSSRYQLRKHSVPPPLPEQTFDVGFSWIYDTKEQLVSYETSLSSDINAALFIATSRWEKKELKQNSRTVSTVGQSRMETADYGQSSHLTNSFKRTVSLNNVH
jgi:hypothetical protein